MLSAPPPTPPRLRLRSKISFSSLSSAAITAVSYSGAGNILSNLAQGLKGNHPASSKNYNEASRGLEVILREEDTQLSNYSHQSTPPPTTLNLTTHCQGCGEHVSLAVPAWITNAIDSSVSAQGAAHHLHFVDKEEERNLKRNDFVEMVVAIAIAIKASPIPHLILNFLKYIFMISVYLDQRFGLHQRAAVVGVNVLEGLVEVEKEVGLMRGLGEGLETSVKSTIAFAKADPYSHEAPFVNEPSSSPPSHHARRPSHTKSTTANPPHFAPPRRPHSSRSLTPPAPITSTNASSSTLDDRFKPLLLPSSMYRRNSKTSSTTSSTTSMKSPHFSPSVPLAADDRQSYSNNSNGSSYSSTMSNERDRALPTRYRRRSIGGVEEEESVERERLRHAVSSSALNTGWAGRALGAAVGRIRG